MVAAASPEVERGRPPKNHVGRGGHLNEGELRGLDTV